VSNDQLTFVAVGALLIQLLVVGAALVRRQPVQVFAFTLGLACILLGALALNPKWLRAPVDLPVAGFALFEVLALLVAALALRGYRAAKVGAWIAFALHLAASGLAVVFVLTFKITRLF
jgi:hypothetical protein